MAVEKFVEPIQKVAFRKPRNLAHDIDRKCLACYGGNLCNGTTGRRQGCDAVRDHCAHARRYDRALRGGAPCVPKQLGHEQRVSPASAVQRCQELRRWLLRNDRCYEETDRRFVERTDVHAFGDRLRCVLEGAQRMGTANFFAPVGRNDQYGRPR